VARQVGSADAQLAAVAAHLGGAQPGIESRPDVVAGSLPGLHPHGARLYPLTRDSIRVRFAPMPAREFFDSLESRADGGKLAGMSNSYVFDIEGEGQWHVTVADGKVDVTEGGGDADATITTNAETFEKIVAGEQNPTTAYMTGKLKITGDLGAAMKLQKLF
jgi:alkyl sulfatase BDS1-like metallo-beta-lactamase superfamily hydrolase